MQFFFNDVVITGDIVGLVVARVKEQDTFYTIIEVLRCIGPILKSSATYALTWDTRAVAVDDVRLPGAWYVAKNGSYVVVR